MKHENAKKFLYAELKTTWIHSEKLKQFIWEFGAILRYIYLYKHDKRTQLVVFKTQLLLQK